MVSICSEEVEVFSAGYPSMWVHREERALESTIEEESWRRLKGQTGYEVMFN